jgi:hypothetical protein
MSGPFYFAWCDEATVWGPDLEREDEEISEYELADAEGSFPSLQTTFRNPRVGLLGPDRQQWCWFAWFNGTAVIALFHGRVVANPENIHAEALTAMFVARPSDYVEQKAALAATMRELPYHDPVFQEQQEVDDDTVLETRALHWQVDPRTLQLGVSNDLEGDETILVTADDHSYAAMETGYGETPLRRVVVKATGTYLQTAKVEVDLTQRLVNAFKGAGSIYPMPLVASFTAQGLLDDWPKPGQSLGGGWAMALSSFAIPAPWAGFVPYAVRYTDKSDSTSIIGVDQRDALGNPLPGHGPREFFIGWRNFDVTFGVSPLLVNFTVECDAARKRTEEVTFTMNANIQSILTDPGAAEEETITLTTSLIDQPVDPEGALPIGNPAINTYFATDRGQQSLQFMMLLSAARLLRRSRAVTIKFRTPWAFMAEIVSTRKSVRLLDPRLPRISGGDVGGATGKIIDYRLTANGKGANVCEVTIGCSIGYGVPLGDAAVGEDTYADDYADDYTESEGAQVSVIPGQLLYEALDGTIVLDDDGLDMLNLTAETIVTELTVINGPNDQYNAINASLVLRHDETRVSTTGDVLGTAVTNLRDTTGLQSGVTYNVLGAFTPGLNTVAGVQTTFAFDGAAGGTLSAAYPIGTSSFDSGPRKNVSFMFYRPSGSTITPDPIGALTEARTQVQLKLLSTDGGDFLSQFDIAVLPLVVPKTIDLEASSL